MDKSRILSAVRSEFQKHHWDTFVDEPPSIAHGGRRNCGAWALDMPKEDSDRRAVRRSCDGRRDAENPGIARLIALSLSYAFRASSKPAQSDC